MPFSVFLFAVNRNLSMDSIGIATLTGDRSKRQWCHFSVALTLFKYVYLSISALNRKFRDEVAFPSVPESETNELLRTNSTVRLSY